MEYYNLLDSAPKVARDVSARLENKEENRRLALKYDFEYYDGTREQGYGGYHYDGRWVAVAERLVERYNLTADSRVLDIGCAKGFLVKDLLDTVVGIEVVGLDISSYALQNAHPDSVGHLVMGACDRLPFADGSFDLALSINTAHNLDEKGCFRSIQEIQRVSPRAAFVQFDAYRDESERQLFEDWMLTAQTYFTPEDWLKFLGRAGYTGDYYWTILLPDGDVL
ncbi:MAG: methyltransferase [Rhodospirillaceae bacterium]|nr:methyltransferase [Rhodospirillaceae bacterium]HAA93396.1 methyltransferase [Rhodospirillaceae bacterium]